jgi:hypothetical protein
LKKNILLLLALLTCASSFAQRKNLTWSNHAIQVTEKAYELYVVVTLERGWFIYSPKQPENALEHPCSNSFEENVKHKQYVALDCTEGIYHEQVDVSCPENPFRHTSKPTFPVTLNSHSAMKMDVCLRALPS